MISWLQLHSPWGYAQSSSGRAGLARRDVRVAGRAHPGRAGDGHGTRSIDYPAGGELVALRVGVAAVLHSEANGGAGRAPDEGGACGHPGAPESIEVPELLPLDDAPPLELLLDPPLELLEEPLELPWPPLELLLDPPLELPLELLVDPPLELPLELPELDPSAAPPPSPKPPYVAPPHAHIAATPTAKSFERMTDLRAPCRATIVPGAIAARMRDFADVPAAQPWLAWRQAGQRASPRVRCATEACHSCPSGHAHQTGRLDPATMSRGVSGALSAGCHSRATAGKRVASTLVRDGRRPWQKGQLAPSTRRHTDTLQTWSRATGQRHQTNRPLRLATWPGAKSPFFVGCHCAATAGATAASEVVRETARPAHAGHPVPLRVRLATVALHTCAESLAQRHHAACFEAATTLSGLRAPFRVGCHSAASSGKRAASVLSWATRRLAQNGQPSSIVARAWQVVRQTWSFATGHTHQTWCVLPTITSPGHSRPFFEGCHCAASSGRSVARLLLGATATCAQ